MTIMADINIEGNIVNYKEILEKLDMNTLQYRIELDEMGYCVTCSKGTIAVFGDLENAIAAMREFEQKTFPKSWSKVPPAMRRALRQNAELSA